MSDYRRPSFPAEWYEEVEQFIEQHDDLKFESVKEFIKFCTNQFMGEYSRTQVSEEEIKNLEKELERLRKDLQE